MSADRRPITTGRLVGQDFDVDVIVLRADIEELLGARRVRTLYSLVQALEDLADRYYETAEPHARAATSAITPALAESWARHEIELPILDYSPIDYHRLLLFAADGSDREATEGGDLAVDPAEVGLAREEQAVDPALVLLDQADDVRGVPSVVDDSAGLLPVHGHDASSPVDGTVLTTPAVAKTVEDGADRGLSGHVGASGEATPDASPLTLAPGSGA
ncbi:hypothetical protein [Rathayibacter sp. PhB151]|uniref:hypothetical protein n=1 Tax=Rathayibacter sp. PhB151 TaxID=2485189 RepID=UPI001063E7BD|nr:hypothetical protein [Rathayibacter sp. PhB151]